MKFGQMQGTANTQPCANVIETGSTDPIRDLQRDGAANPLGILLKKAAYRIEGEIEYIRNGFSNERKLIGSDEDKLEEILHFIGEECANPRNRH